MTSSTKVQMQMRGILIHCHLDRDCAWPFNEISEMLVRKQAGTRVLTLLNEKSPLFGKVLPGDVFLLIDGEDTSALNHNEIRERLVRKQAGTRVITLQRSAKASAQTRTTPE